MKKLSLATIILSFLLGICLLSPIFVFASESQNTDLTNQIKVEVIDGVWLDGNNQEITKINLPEYLSAGEEIDFDGGLSIKNIGVDAFARVKAVGKIDGNESNIFNFDLQNDWIKGSDGYYYFCNSDKSAIIESQEIMLVIEKITLSTSLKNIDKDKELSISLSLEVIDANSNEWEEGWATNPPNEWFNSKPQNQIV